MRKQIKRAMFDLDGCVADTYGLPLISRLKSRFGVEIEYEELSDVNFTKHPLIEGEMLSTIFSEKDFYSTLQVYPKAVEAMRLLRENGVAIDICTVRPNIDDVRNDTLKWFHDDNIPFDSLHILPRRASHDENGKAKVRMVNASKCQVFFEDDPVYASHLAKACKFGFVIRQPYNINIKFPENVCFVDNILDGAQHILKLNNE